MQTLEVTDEQYAVIQRLRATMSEQVVGKYGFVREQDAVQYLIDTLEGATEDGELGDLEFEIDGGSSGSTATDDVAAAVEAAIEGDAPPEGVEAVSYDEDGEDTDDGDSSVEDEAADDADEPAAEDEEGTGDEDDDAGDADADAEDGDDGGAADDDDMLDKMMSLLETHDDKWEESPSGDYRYRVDLPDGGTKDVQTKDDVRALLFKNYR